MKIRTLASVVLAAFITLCGVMPPASGATNLTKSSVANTNKNSAKKPSAKSKPKSDQSHGGATAECNDGTYSYSANHRGTCSHHGGVKRWFK